MASWNKIVHSVWNKNVWINDNMLTRTCSLVRSAQTTYAQFSWDRTNTAVQGRYLGVWGITHDSQVLPLPPWVTVGKPSHIHKPKIHPVGTRGNDRSYGNNQVIEQKTVRPLKYRPTPQAPTDLFAAFRSVTRGQCETGDTCSWVPLPKQAIIVLFQSWITFQEVLPKWHQGPTRTITVPSKAPLVTSTCCDSSSPGATRK